MRNLTRFDPVTDIFDDLMKGFFVRPVSSANMEAQEQVRRARIDVLEQNGEFKVLAELPGVKKEDIKIQVEGDNVSISAEARVEREAKEGERVLHAERYYGKIARTFVLGAELDEAKASAKFENGVLELTLPRKQSVVAKQITIR
ncbi:MAG: Hsp20/alpha crystallin family protein [Betaproteobacteria bacterium]|nr:Hsp20/alpha crystallin family protein [Betaproteobacteria bacterium]